MHSSGAARGLSDLHQGDRASLCTPQLHWREGHARGTLQTGKAEGNTMITTTSNVIVSLYEHSYFLAKNPSPLGDSCILWKVFYIMWCHQVLWFVMKFLYTLGFYTPWRAQVTHLGGHMQVRFYSFRTRIFLNEVTQEILTPEITNLIGVNI